MLVALMKKHNVQSFFFQKW